MILKNSSVNFKKEKKKMGVSRNQSNRFSSCSLLMAALFVYSASFQLNDPDWYLWFPLYASASAVNLLQIAFPSETTNQTAKLASGLGFFLFLKVVMEDYVNGIAGFWSLDLGERVVREKTGSGLVMASMILQLKAFEAFKRKRAEVGSYMDFCMVMLVAFSFGLPLFFFALAKEI